MRLIGYVFYRINNIMVKWNAKEVRVLPFIVRRDSGPFVLQDVEL